MFDGLFFLFSFVSGVTRAPGKFFLFGVKQNSTASIDWRRTAEEGDKKEGNLVIQN